MPKNTLALGPGETLSSRLRDLEEAALLAYAPRTPGYSKERRAWLNEIVRATLEDRAPNRPHPAGRDDPARKKTL